MALQRYLLVILFLTFGTKETVSNIHLNQEKGLPEIQIAQQHLNTKDDNPVQRGANLEQNNRLQYEPVEPNTIYKSTKQNDVFPKSLQSLLENPKIVSFLMANLDGTNRSSVQGLLEKVLDSFQEEDINLQTLIAFLEFLLSKLQYFLTPEAMESKDQCIADVSAYIQGITKFQMWALQMLDASAKPGKSILQGAIRFLGNYDECLEVAHTVTNSSAGTSHVIKGGYAHFYFSIPLKLLNFTNGGNPLPIDALHSTLQWDLCLPPSCNDTQLTEAASMLPLNGTGIKLLSAHFAMVSDWKKDPGAIAAVAVLCFLVLLTIIGTLYDIISAEVEQCRSEPKEEESDIETDYGVNNTEVTVTDASKLVHARNGDGPGLERMDLPGTSAQEQRKRDGFGRQLLLSFSLHKNTEKILNTKTGEGNLRCIHGIRVLSMAWVILGHAVSWDGLTTYENVLEYAGWIKRFTMQFIVNADLAVDTFFLLSGCLVTFLFLRECEKSPKRRPTVRQMVIYYVHRWWRLTPVYMLILMIYTGLVWHITTGPMAETRNLIDRDYCRQNWWTNILYINNLYKVDQMCLPASWFLANDMQFYVVAPLALLPIAFGISWLGYIVISLFLATHIVSYGYLEWQTGGSYLLLNKHIFFDTIYRLPWCRVGVFAIGMFLGAILQKTQCNLRIRRHLLIIGWQVFLGIGLLCTYATYDYLGFENKVWDLNTRIIYNTLARPGWGLFVAWIILVCCTGNGGFINSILSWPAWIPLGRLTYGAYLLHTVLLDYSEFSIRSIRYADMIFVGYHYIGTFVAAYGLSFITSILVESPCMALEKAVLTKLNIKK